MNNLPINRDNNSWEKINNQFLKGGFDWYNQYSPEQNRWYYKYYILDESERYSCLKVAQNRRRNKVTCWLRNIEKFEEINEKNKKEDKKNEKNEDKENEKNEDEENEKKGDKVKEKAWLIRWGDSNDSMSWRKTKYGQ